MKYPGDQRLYKNSLPFDGRLDESLEYLKERIQIGKASMLILEGEQGEGKTTMAIHSLQFFIGKRINLADQYAMGGKEFLQKFMITHEKNLGAVIYDEAGDFNTRGSLSQFNQRLNRAFETFRVFNLLVILVLPSSKVLDSSLFDKGIPRLLIRCYGRGKSYGNYKVFFPNEINMIRGLMNTKYRDNPKRAYSQVHPNYYGHFHDLDSEMRDRIHEFSLRGKKDIFNESIAVSLNLKTYEDIAIKVGRSVKWVKDKVKQFGFKERKIWKRRKYFDGSVVERLEREKA
jgi:hypothetical protein